MDVWEIFLYIAWNPEKVIKEIKERNCILNTSSNKVPLSLNECSFIKCWSFKV